MLAATEIALVLTGWAVAQHQHCVYPDIHLSEAAAPVATLKFVVLSLPAPGAVLIPSLWLLFRVFKTEPIIAGK